MRGIVVSEKYVVHGAKLKCNQGSACVLLSVKDDRRIKIDGKYIANKSDVFKENIPAFGNCQALGGLVDPPGGPDWSPNHMTLISGGMDRNLVRENIPCEIMGSRPDDDGLGGDPNISLTPWLDCKEDVLIGGHPAVVESSYIMCTVGGGTIEIIESGQSE